MVPMSLMRSRITQHCTTHASVRNIGFTAFVFSSPFNHYFAKIEYINLSLIKLKLGPTTYFSRLILWIISFLAYGKKSVVPTYNLTGLEFYVPELEPQSWWARETILSSEMLVVLFRGGNWYWLGYLKDVVLTWPLFRRIGLLGCEYKHSYWYCWSGRICIRMLSSRYSENCVRLRTSDVTNSAVEREILMS